MVRYLSGWTAVITLAALAAGAEVAKGIPLLRKGLWALVAIAGVVAAWNHWNEG